MPPRTRCRPISVSPFRAVLARFASPAAAESARHARGRKCGFHHSCAHRPIAPGGVDSEAPPLGVATSVAGLRPAVDGKRAERTDRVPEVALIDKKLSL